jgi:hypothetical protein
VKVGEELKGSPSQASASFLSSSFSRIEEGRGAGFSDHYSLHVEALQPVLDGPCLLSLKSPAVGDMQSPCGPPHVPLDVSKGSSSSPITPPVPHPRPNFISTPETPLPHSHLEPHFEFQGLSINGGNKDSNGKVLGKKGSSLTHLSHDLKRGDTHLAFLFALRTIFFKELSPRWALGACLHEFRRSVRIQLCLRLPRVCHLHLQYCHIVVLGSFPSLRGWVKPDFIGRPSVVLKYVTSVNSMCGAGLLSTS